MIDNREKKKWFNLVDSVKASDISEVLIANNVQYILILICYAKFVLLDFVLVTRMKFSHRTNENFL